MAAALDCRTVKIVARSVVIMPSKTEVSWYSDKHAFEDAGAMRTANMSETGLLIEVDVQELRILAAALSIMCNAAHILDDLEERLSGTKDKAETLLFSIRSLNSIFDRLNVQYEEPVPRPSDERCDVSAMDRLSSKAH